MSRERSTARTGPEDTRRALRRDREAGLPLLPHDGGPGRAASSEPALLRLAPLALDCMRGKAVCPLRFLKVCFFVAKSSGSE